MPSVLAIVSKGAFEKQWGGDVGTVHSLSSYESNPAAFSALREGGALYLVTARPSDKLWLLAVLDEPRKKGDRWIGAVNQTPITDISQLIPKLKFASGSGIKAKPGQLGMSLQTPRALTDEDESAIRSLITVGKAKKRTPKAKATPTPKPKPEPKPNAKLAEAMAAGDEDSFLVYADELLQEGDPRGELVQIQHRRALFPNDKTLLKAENDLLQRHAKSWIPSATPKKSFAAHTWRLGFFDSIRLKDVTPAFVRAVLDHPSSQFLRELTIDASFRVTPGVILALAKRPRPSIRSLILRQGSEGFKEVPLDPNDPSYKAGYGEGSGQHRGNVIWKALPNLKSLEIRAFQLIGELAHPALESITIDGYPICDDDWNAPKLSRITWEVGVDETGTGTDAHSEMVAAIWEGKLPKLRQVNLRGCGAIFDDELDDDEDDEDIDDTCAASLLRHAGFRRRIKQLDELLLPEIELKSQKEIAAWLAKQKK